MEDSGGKPQPSLAPLCSPRLGPTTRGRCPLSLPGWGLVSRSLCRRGTWYPLEGVGVGFCPCSWLGLEVPLTKGLGWNPEMSTEPAPPPPRPRHHCRGLCSIFLFERPALIVTAKPCPSVQIALPRGPVRLVCNERGANPGCLSQSSN